jgi:hypothetical protein
MMCNLVSAGGGSAGVDQRALGAPHVHSASRHRPAHALGQSPLLSRSTAQLATQRIHTTLIISTCASVSLKNLYYLVFAGGGGAGVDQRASRSLHVHSASKHHPALGQFDFHICFSYLFFTSVFHNCSSHLLFTSEKQLVLSITSYYFL